MWFHAWSFLVVFFTASSSNLVAGHTNNCLTCQPVRQFGNDTLSIGYFTLTDGDVKCQNKEPIRDLMQCSGHCESKATYTTVMKGFTNKCNCCQPTRTVTRSANLTCTDGSTRTKSYTVPEVCACSACSGGSWLDSLNSCRQFTTQCS
jgi:hypothetical protein